MYKIQVAVFLCSVMVGYQHRGTCCHPLILQTPLTSPWRWRQYCPPKQYPATSLYSVTTQNTMFWIFITMKTTKKDFSFFYVVTTVTHLFQ